jgi:amino-acid N-acetyltransferase
MKTIPLRIAAVRASDIPALEAFIAAYTGDGTLLPRTRANLRTHRRDFRLAWVGTRLVGCGALQVTGKSLAEVRSVAVDPKWRGRGIGGTIVDKLLRDARRLGLDTVFCLTRRVEFFAGHGFAVVPKERFPHKVWNDCRLCPRQLCCDETAMERAVALPARAQSRPRAGVAPHAAAGALSATP